MAIRDENTTPYIIMTFKKDELYDTVSWNPHLSSMPNQNDLVPILFLNMSIAYWEVRLSPRNNPEDESPVILENILSDKNDEEPPIIMIANAIIK